MKDMWEILNKEILILKEMKAEMGDTRAERCLYYSSMSNFIQDFCFYFATVSLKAGINIDYGDYWWRKDALTALVMISEKENKFLEEYINQLFEVLCKNVAQNKFTCIVCINLQKDKIEAYKIKGYKFYEKKDGIWKGTKYIKNKGSII